MRFLPAFIVDLVLVLIFAAIGRASHDENPLELLLTAWPFLIALAVGYLVAALLPSRPRQPWSVQWGAVVWVVTVAGGMLIRVLSGDTAEVPFVIVATITLGVFLLGWRALTSFTRRRRNAHRTGADGSAADEPATDESAADEPTADRSAVAIDPDLADGPTPAEGPDLADHPNRVDDPTTTSEAAER